MYDEVSDSLLELDELRDQPERVQKQLADLKLANLAATEGI